MKILNLEGKRIISLNYFSLKIFAKGSIKPNTSGNIEGNLALPFAYINDLGYNLNYNLPYYGEKGHLNTYLTSGGYPIFTLDLKGGLREASLSATTALEDFR